MSKQSTKLKKSSAQSLAIADRRRLVHLKLQKRYPLRQIAEEVGVSLDTVKKDKKAIAKSLAAEHVEVKALDLDDLDSMERECIDSLEQRIREIGRYLESDDLDDKILTAMYHAAGQWWERRLRLKQVRGKWLGFETKAEEDGGGATVIDNSVHVTVNAPGAEKPQGFGEYVKSFMPELPDIEGKMRELSAPEAQGAEDEKTD